MKWELDWIGRMQQSDGSVLSVVDEPSAKGPASAAAEHGALDGDRPLLLRPGHDVGVAHHRGGLRLRRGGLRRRARRQQRLPRLRRRAARAGPEGLDLGAGEPRRLLLQLAANPTVARGRAGGLRGAADRATGCSIKKLQAALYLFEATGTTTYRDFFDANYSGINLMKSGYSDGSHGEEQETLLEYTHAPNATASVVSAIKTKYLASLQTSANLGAATGSRRSVPGVPHRLLVGDQPDQERPGQPALRRGHVRDRRGDQRRRPPGAPSATSTACTA